MLKELRRWIEAGKPASAPPRKRYGGVNEYGEFKEPERFEPIRKVTLRTKKKPDVLVRGGAADRGEMTRVDVFRRANRRGAWEYFLVPVYPHQIFDRATWPTPPSRAVQAYKPETEWPEMGDAHEFMWSFYPLSYIAVDLGEVRHEGYFRGLDRSTGAVNLSAHHSKDALTRGIGVKTAKGLRKFTVDRPRAPLRDRTGDAHVAWRGLHLSQPSRLSVAQGQLVVAQDGGDVRLALEDIAWIVLDSPRATLTAALLSACMAKGIAVIVTDETHTPSGLALPFGRHHRQGDVARIQAAAGKPLKKRLWQALVQAKILNQAAALDALSRGGAALLREMAGRVGSGDPGNVEAQAARYYWGQLWTGFKRSDEGDRRNMLLNYGYAVVRSGVARALVASGLIPAFGLHHASVSNAFNLADDLFEPFRPFVDVLAWRTAPDGAPCREPLSVGDRRTMATALLAEARMDDDVVTLLVAAERASESLVRCFDGGGPTGLDLPEFVP